MSEYLYEGIASLASANSMSSNALLKRLYHLALDAGKRCNGTIMEIGAYRGASTTALAMGVRDAGHGHVYSIDPHMHYRGVLGGTFSPEDHVAFEETIRKYGVEKWVTHYCRDSATIAKDWNGKIDILWVDGDHSYEGVATDLKLWLPFVEDGGVIVLDDHSPGSEVAQAVRDHMPFSRFQSIERIGNALVLRRTAEPRSMVLCGGMQSSGSTLVSMCFLQRDDMDGIYDMDNPFIQQDFSRVFSSTVWVKMTIGSFRLRELIDLYTAQGWLVHPLLVYREPEEILASLITKWYGLDGCTGDDPPLFTRFTRYMSDIQDAKAKKWPVLNYAEFISAPEEVLLRICALLKLPWDPRMMTWPKADTAFAYPSSGNESLRETLASESGLVDTINRYKAGTNKVQDANSDNRTARAKALATRFNRVIEGMPVSDTDLEPSHYRGTRRDSLEQELQRLRRYIDRITKHPVIGSVIRLWAALVNPNLKKPE